MRKLKLDRLVRTTIMQLLKTAGGTYLVAGVIVLALHGAPVISESLMEEPIKMGLFMIFGGATTLLLWEVCQVTDD